MGGKSGPAAYPAGPDWSACSSAFFLYGSGGPKILTRKTAICARVTEPSGQCIAGSSEQPPVIPSAANCATHAATQRSTPTSSKTAPVAAGGN